MTNQSLDRVPSLEEGQEGRQQARTLSWSKAQALRPFAERATVSFAHLFSTLVVGWFTAHFRDSLLGRVRFATRVCSGHLDSAGLGSLWGWSRLLPKPRTVRSPFKTASMSSWRAASSSASLLSESSAVRANLMLSVPQSRDQPFLQGVKG